MAAPLIRTWLDTNAPNLGPGLGSINALLQAVLVDGYDVLPGLGWTKEYEDVVNHKTVFRNSATAGTGAYLRVQQHHATLAYQQVPVVKMYESMSDVDTGLGPFQNEDRSFWVSSSATLTNYVPWVIIGDNRRFWLFIWTGCYNIADLTALRACANVRNVGSNFFGDLVKHYTADSFCSAIICNTGNYNGIFNAVGYIGSVAPAAYTAGYVGLPRKVDGTVTPVSVVILRPFSADSGTPTFPPYPNQGRLLYSKVFINVGGQDGLSGETGAPRATIPGVRWVFHPYNDADFLQYGTIVDDTEFRFIQTGTYSTSSASLALLIDVGTSWDEV
jgi:hypothetical protein